MNPGIHNITMEQYLADPCPEPSLSSGLAAMLISRSPRHVWDAHPRLNIAAKVDQSDAMDVGSIAHSLVLEGDDSRICVIDAEDSRRKPARPATRPAPRVCCPSSSTSSPTCFDLRGRENTEPCYHLYTLRLGAACKISRDDLFLELRNKGIYCQVHYIPIYRQPYYVDRFSVVPGRFPETELYFASCLSLPLFPDLDDRTWQFVVESISSLIVHAQ